ncbi:hypothetical protein B0H14DRAFT_3515403 [Mycena olivaceomarginata]|nr:hypothetical protein B0H14DRAFT_3515403 [Mycena olivaceomarginata]
MAPQEWGTPSQREYLHKMLEKYRDARASDKENALERFWLKLDEGWFTRYPVEDDLGITVDGPGAEPLTADQLNLIGQATKKMKKRLRTWMHWRKSKSRAVVNKRSALFEILKRKKKTRPLRALEVYQKLYRAKIRSEVMQRGYGLLNEEAEADRVALARGPNAEVSVMTPEETLAEEQRVEEEAIARVRSNRAACMSMLRTTAMELFAAEPESVRGEVLAKMAEMNGDRASGLSGDVSETRMPEEYQHAIEQLPEVVSKVTTAIEEETGWMGLFLAGGPMPNRDGSISIKTFCFGTTPNGADFAASHSNFAEVKAEFGKFLKRAFPHDVRDARAIVSEGEAATVPGGLIPFDSDVENDNDNGSDDEREKASSSATPATAPSTAKPKRVRRKKVAAAVLAAVSPVQGVALPAPTLALSTATDPVFPIPADFDQTIEEIVSNFDGNDDFTPLQDAATWTLGLADSWDGIVPPAEDFEALSPWNGLSLPSSQIEEDVVQPRPVPRPMHRGGAFAVDRDIGGSPGRAPRSTQDFGPSSSAPDSGSVPTPAARLTAPRVVSVTGASATVATPASSALAASATLTTPAATLPAATTATRTTPAGGPPRSGAALAVWNARQLERAHTAAPSTVEAASPSSDAPQFPESRPRANVPRGHPQASVKKVAGKKAPAKKKAGGRGRGRPRKNAGAVVEGEGEGEEEEGNMSALEGEGGGEVQEQAQPPSPSLPETPLVIAPLTGAAAAAESARVRREEQGLLRDRTEQLRISKDLEKKAAEAEAAKARRRNPAGGADLVVVTRPQRSRVPARNPDGSPIVREAEMDATLLASFKGKRKAKADAPAAPKRKKARR